MINIKDKILGASGSLSGTLSFLGSYQVCHNACLALVAFLTLLGFSVAGMPLLFLTKVAVPFWIAAVAALFLILILKYGKGFNFSEKIILLNSGLVIAGIPFQQLEKFNYIFWIIGGILVVFGIGWYVHDKFKEKRQN